MSWFAKLSPWHSECDAPKGKATEEALRRRQAAEETLEEVEKLAVALETHRRKNHFGESLERVFRGVA